MADYRRRPNKELVREVSLDDPDFLKEIVRKVLQRVLEAEIAPT